MTPGETLPVEALQAARRVVKEVRTLVADLARLRSENETLRARRQELLEALTAIAGSLETRPRARQPGLEVRGDRARTAAHEVGRRAPVPVIEGAMPADLEVVAGLGLAPAMRSVWCGGRGVSLTPREFALLAYLLDHRGQPLTRSTLLGAVFETSSDDPRTLKVHIHSVRSKLERLGPVPVRIATVYRIGYRLDDVVENGC